MKTTDTTPATYWISREGGRAEGPLSLDDLWEGWQRREIIEEDAVCRVGDKTWRTPASVLRWRIWKPKLITWAIICAVVVALISWSILAIRTRLREVREYEARPEVISMRQKEKEAQAKDERMRNHLNGQAKVQYAINPSSWDGSVKEAKIFIEKAVRDPSSLKYNHWDTRVNEDNLATTVDFTATNGFGGPSRETWMFSYNRATGELKGVINTTTQEVIYFKQ